MGKTISIKVLFGIYLLLMAGKVFAFSCNVDGGSSIGAGTTSVYVNLDPVIQPGQNLVVDLSQHISCWNDYGGWYDTDHINLVQGSAGNDSNLLIVFYVQIMPDDFVMQLHRF